MAIDSDATGTSPGPTDQPAATSLDLQQPPPPGTHLSCMFLYNFKALLLSITPNHIYNHFGKDSRTLVNGLSMLANWWKNSFGLRMRRGDVKLDSTDAKNQDSNRFTLGYFMRLLQERQAYEDDLVQLFCTLCRALGVRTRFVSSISLEKGKALEEFVYLPEYWVEAYYETEQKWIPVDCTRAIVNCRQSMEVGSAGTGRSKASTRQHTFVVGIDEEGFIADVTKRYSSKYYGNTWKARLPDEEPFQQFLTKLNYTHKKQSLYDEEGELESFTEAEPIPETLAGFHMHGKYVLESRLKKYETFYPPDDTVGTFRSDPIHLRSSVKKVRSKEAWYTQFARSLIPDVEPVKTIQLPKRKKRGFVAPDEDPYEPGPMQPLYGEWQTVPYAPPMAVDGKVPRNSHGNVDLFQPEMLPIGCAYIPYSGVWRSAKELGVDYSDACVRFAFHGRMAVPNLQGIVVCKEYEQRVLALHFKRVEESLQADNVEMERQELLRKRREALSVKISNRLTEEYGQESSEPDVPIQSAFSKSAQDSDVDDFSFD